MARVAINTGASANDGTGDNLRAAGGILNNNFLELYTYLGAGSTTVLSAPLWSSTNAGINTLSKVGIGTTNPRFALEVGAVGTSGTTLFVNGDARVTGIVTIGPASITLNGITNIINVGTGITINGSTGIISATAIVLGGTTLTGAAVTFITAGSGISVDQSTGNVTITATGTGSTSQWVTTAAGIHTLSNVGIGTTNPTSALTVKGNTSLETLNVSGVSTLTTTDFTGHVQLKANSGNSSLYISDDNGIYAGAGNDLRIWHNSSDSISRITEDGGQLIIDANPITINHGGDTKLQTIGSGITVTGTTVTNQLSVSGVATASTLNVGTGGTVITTTTAGLVGIGTTNPTSALTVSGNVLVSGVSTLTSNVSVGGTISINGGVKLETNNATIVGTSGSTGEIKRIAGAPFFYDGSAWREFVLSSGTPVTVPADTEWNNVAFRATFDTNFTDAKFGANPVYVSAGSTIVGAAVTIGTGAFRNDGAVGSGISYAYRSEYDFTGSWTIEFWMYVDSSPDNNFPESLVSMHSVTGIGTSGNWALIMKDDQYENKFISWYNQNHPSYINGTELYNVAGATWDSIILDKWNHFALVRESNNGSLHFYVNGIEQSLTSANTIIDNDILDINVTGLHFGGDTSFTVGVTTFNSNSSADVIFDDVRISTGVGTAGQRYTSIGISTYATFTPSAVALPTTGTLSSYVQPPGDKYGEIVLGGSPTWRGTSGVTVSQQSSGNYRVSFASTYTNSNDYFVLSHAMDQGFASYVGIARSTTHVDFAINKESDNAVVNTGSLAVQIKNHP